MDKPILEYFMQITGEKFAGMDKRFDKIDLTLESLKEEKWKLTGSMLIINGICSCLGAAAILLLEFYIRGH